MTGRGRATGRRVPTSCANVRQGELTYKGGASRIQQPAARDEEPMGSDRARCMNVWDRSWVEEETWGLMLLLLLMMMKHDSDGSGSGGGGACGDGVVACYVAYLTYIPTIYIW